MSQVAVTGASGHLGFHVARSLLERGHAVRLLLRDPSGPLVRRLVRDGGALVRVVGEPWDPAALAPALAGVEALFHLAAVNSTSGADPANTLRGTVHLTRTVLEAAALAGVETVVYTSSVVVLGRSPDPRSLRTEHSEPTAAAESPYVEGKTRAERLAREAAALGRDVRIVYPAWVFGPDDPGLTPPHRVVRDFVRRDGQPWFFDGGISVSHVAEVAAGHVAAWETGARAGRYVLGGENLTFQAFYTRLAEWTGHRPPRWRLPTAGLHLAGDAAGRIFDAVGRRSPVSPAYLRAVVGRFSWYDSERARRELGYQVRPAAETLREAVGLARHRLAGTYRLNLGARSPGAAAQTSSSVPPAARGTLLVTGVPGWLGNRLVEILAGQDDGAHPFFRRPVRLLVQPEHRALLDLPPGFAVHEGDLRDPTTLRGALAGVTTVFHLAGVIYPRRVRDFQTVNVEGTRNLLDACAAAGVRRFLFMSTDAVCGHGSGSARTFDEHTPPRPHGHYGRSKLHAENLVLERTRNGQVDGTVLRGFWFWGTHAPARQLRFARMFRSWPRQVVFGDGRNLRSISHVDDVARAFLRAAPEPATVGKCYWVGDAVGGYPVDTVYAALARASDRPYRPFYVPRIVCRGLGLLDQLLARGFGVVQSTLHAAAKFPLDIAGRSDAATRDFGYAPQVSLEAAARELAAEAAREG